MTSERGTRAHLVAFALLVAAAGTLAVAAVGSLRSIGLIQVSAGLSIAASVVAVVAIRSGRRGRP